MEIPKAEAPVAQWTRIEFGVKEVREKLIEMGQRMHVVETTSSAHTMDILKLQLADANRESLEAGITAALDRQANQRWSPFDGCCDGAVVWVEHDPGDGCEYSCYVYLCSGYG
jgi:hypothetical protein